LANGKTDIGRLIVLTILTSFFLGFLILNAQTYKAGFLFFIINVISLVVIVSWDKIPKKRPDRKLFALQKDWYIDLIIGVAVGFFVLFLLSNIGLSIATPSTPISTFSNLNPLAAEIATFLTNVIAAPFVEELAFRTVLFAIFWVVLGFGFIPSTLVSSAIFAFYHITVYGGQAGFFTFEELFTTAALNSISGDLIAAFLIAVIFCYVNKWRGSVTSSIGGHSAINGGISSGAFVFVG
jgi:membrane protease YdiL (CAAX protease family)